MTHGHSRKEAIQRMQRALAETEIEGLPTTLPLLREILADSAFRDGVVFTDYLASLDHRETA
jgi:biotin carboxylase